MTVQGTAPGPVLRSVEEQVAEVLAGVHPLAPMELRLLDAHGCTLAHPVAADVPHAEPGAGGRHRLPEGARLGALQIGMLASVGLERVAVHPRPRVVVLAMGDELAEPGSPEGVWDADSHVLAAAAREAGAVAFRTGTVADDARAVLHAVEDELLRADAVVVSGAGGPRARPQVEAALARLGKISYAEVAMSPGGVVGWGRVGSAGTPVFLLPGEPAAAYVSFEMFVRPAIRRLLGSAPHQRRLVRAVSLDPLHTDAGRRSYLPGWLEVGDGRYVVRGYPGRDTPAWAEYARCNALIVVPEDSGDVASGTSVLVMVLEEGLP